jgi:NADH-quinone oxidoreductase subunit J
MDLNAFLFYALAMLTAGCAIAVVVTQNIVRAATWLMFTLAGTAGIFFHLGADFVGSTQLLVYVGGTLVLVIFGVMLTAQGRFIHMKASAAEWAISLTVGLLLYAVLATTLMNVTPPLQRPTDMPDSAVLGAALLGSSAGASMGLPPTDFSIQATIQRATDPRRVPEPGVAYLLPFEIVSVHLLVVLVGAAYLARTKRRRQPRRGA